MTSAAGPIIPLILDWRRRRGKEDPSRIGERLGVPSRPRPTGRLIWVHGASVGETLAAIPLIRRLLETDSTLNVLVTSGTVTSATLLDARLPEHCFHSYMPVDSPRHVERFLAHWRPDGVVWLESDLWPNMLVALQNRTIPAVLVNARFSARSARRWQYARGLFRHMIRSFSLVCPASKADAAALAALTSLPIGPIGNLKVAIVSPEPDPAGLNHLRAEIRDRPVWLAASTHRGEETVALDAHIGIRRQFPDALLILIPRHPRRGDEIATEITARGLAHSRRNLNEDIRRDTAVYLADTLGEMATFLALAPVTFVGGSIAPMGAHNPVEAANAESAILMGPHCWAFDDVVRGLQDASAMIRVETAAAMAEAVIHLLDDPAARRRQTKAAALFAQSLQSTVDRITEAVKPILLPGSGRPS